MIIALSGFDAMLQEKKFRIVKALSVACIDWSKPTSYYG